MRCARQVVQSRQGARTRRRRKKQHLHTQALAHAGILQLLPLDAQGGEGCEAIVSLVVRDEVLDDWRRDDIAYVLSVVVLQVQTASVHAAPQQLLLFACIARPTALTLSNGSSNGIERMLAAALPCSMSGLWWGKALYSLAQQDPTHPAHSCSIGNVVALPMLQL